jgi:rod shape determining protein RodA
MIGARAAGRGPSAEADRPWSRARLRAFDWTLLCAALMAIAFGAAMIYSATLRGEPVVRWWDDLVFKQLAFAAAGIVLLVVLSLTELRALAVLAPWIYGATILSLVLVLAVGETTFGSVRSFVVGPVTFQPSELCKLAMILVLAAYFERFDLRKGQHVLGSLALVALPMALVLSQPDLSTALLLGAIWAGMAFVAGLRLPHVALLALLAPPLLFVMLRAEILETYQMLRILAWRDPAIDPGGIGYQNLHTLIAVGSGGLSGIGFARGLQSQGGWLPLMHTDNIYAIVAEELGFIGGALLLLLLGFIVLRVLRAARASGERLSALVCVGVAVYLLAQVTVNVGVVLQLLPVTGVSLPFVSYGGSSLVTALGGIGLVQAALLRRRTLAFGRD